MSMTERQKRDIIIAMVACAVLAAGIVKGDLTLEATATFLIFLTLL